MPNSPCDRGRDTVCIDTYRVLDSCRDKDCFEDVRVYLTCYGQEIIDRTTAHRTKDAHVLWSYIDIDDVPFNRGFYQLTIRIYIKILCEACLGPGNVRDFDGIAVVEKKVVLFGSEGNVSVFKSEYQNDGFCCSGENCGAVKSNNLPVAVLETVDPIILNSKIVEPDRHCPCCCTVDEVPDRVCSAVSGDLADGRDSNKLLVSLGLFSVVRIERPAQYLINASEYSVPAKECVSPIDDDPCSLFKKMEFPIGEFSIPSKLPAFSSSDYDNAKKCGCDRKDG
ncbi:MAG: hypothetical protein IJK58_03015 [Clostridia bacterium]|nr:hypothetical protein [Clostridia bacterium]